MKIKTTVVIGASENPERYSNRVTRMLKHKGMPVIAVGLKSGEIEGVKIQTGFPKVENVNTVTLYIGAKNQPSYYDYIISLKPVRVIFNPGAENPEFEKILEEKGIEAMKACTLIMLTIGNY